MENEESTHYDRSLHGGPSDERAAGAHPAAGGSSHRFGMHEPAAVALDAATYCEPDGQPAFEREDLFEAPAYGGAPYYGQEMVYEDSSAFGDDPLEEPLGVEAPAYARPVYDQSLYNGASSYVRGPAPLQDEQPAVLQSRPTTFPEEPERSSTSAPVASVEERPAPKNNFLITAILYALVALFAAWEIFGTAYDNDIWFILATGREILDNGIPYTNPFSLHENMGIVVQQWVPCVISYLIYSAGGFVALGIWVLALFAIMAFSFFRVGRILRADRYGSELIALVFLPLTIVMSSYASVRPHLYTMIAFIWVVGLLTLYRRTSRIAFLIPLPFIVAVHVNFQASMAPFDLVIMVCFLIPNFLGPFHRRGKLLKVNCLEWGYSRLPLLIAALVSAVALLANPYFVDGAAYLVNSFGSAAYKDYINEMNPLAPASHWLYALGALFFIVTATFVGAQGLRRVDFPLLLLAGGTTYLSFTQIRNIWLGPLFCALYLVSIGAHHSIALWAKARASRVLGWVACAAGVIGSCLLIAFEAPGLQALPRNDADTPVAALDYLDQIGADKDRTRILNFFNSGGYFEYRGYKVVMDPRPELWSPSITGLAFDYYKEFVDMTLGETYIDDFIAKYDLNVYVVDKTDPSVDIFKNQELYLEISGGENYRAFIERSAYEYITGEDISTAPQAIRHVSKNASP